MPTDDLLIFKKCSDETAAERAALTELASFNVDVAAVYMMVFGSLREIRATRPAIANELTKFDLGRIDAVEKQLYALMHLHRECLSAAAPVGGLVELGEEATAARERMNGVATLLGKLGLINPSRLGEVKGAVGYRNVGMDLLIITGVLRDSWASIENKTPLTLAEINAAEDLGKRLMDAVSVREQAPAVTQAALDERQRGWTLFARNYDEVRAAVTYVRRHEGDADQIAPSLYSGRIKSKKSDAQPSAPATTTPVAAPTPAAPAIEPGMPGASPFISS